MFRRTVFGLAAAAFAVLATAPASKADWFSDVFNPHVNSASGTQSVTPPFIDGNGNVWTGSASNGNHGTMVGPARLVHLGPQGQAWWEPPLSYRGNIWGVVAPRRAPSYLDRPVQQTPPSQLPQPPGLSVAQPQYTQPPIQNVQPRFYYREFDGTKASFTSLGGGSWINLANGSKYYFSQVGGDNYRVILRDKSRNLDVMLNADGTKYWSTGNGWNGLGQGLGTWGQ